MDEAQRQAVAAAVAESHAGGLTPAVPAPSTAAEESARTAAPTEAAAAHTERSASPDKGAGTAVEAASNGAKGDTEDLEAKLSRFPTPEYWQQVVA